MKNLITKKKLKRISKGFHDDLMEGIEFLIDTYDEDKFDAGYKSCLEDMSVRAYRLAEHIHMNLNTGGHAMYATIDELSMVIEEYFDEAMKK